MILKSKNSFKQESENIDSKSNDIVETVNSKESLSDYYLQAIIDSLSAISNRIDFIEESINRLKSENNDSNN